ncbi:hypothetical protein C6P46_006667 [Rhodotorula mucilaginosa]|uniref:Major facilitator superfamily domain-containing protein n=1 Tax=Rhodotorula mucilaginosa TaxID=5537 RepID=A0A9P6VWN0_RHOMI|nr:hypothetical protein C6P46_006667 [Rhodotorula mucilaginosa]
MSTLPVSPAPAAASVGRVNFFRSTVFQIIVVGLISFVGPGLWNGGALALEGTLPVALFLTFLALQPNPSEPAVLSSRTCIVFSLMGLGCIFAPVIINAVGVKNTLLAGTLGWSVYTAALYQNNRYGTEWFVILGAVICGISAGLYWAAEGAIVLSYPEPHKRGRYLAVWLFFKNSGTILAGAINLGTNIHRSTGGKVNYKTLLAFIALQVLALPFAFLISKPERVQRDDRTPVPLPPKTTVKEQLKALWKACSTQKVGVLLPVFFASWYYWGYSSSFLTLYFSVRARALASFLSAICGVFATTLLGFFLDSQRLSIAARARIGAAATFTLFSGILIWAIVVQHQFTEHNPGKLDWTDTTGQFGKGFGLYVMLNAAGNCVQNYLVRAPFVQLPRAGFRARMLTGFTALLQYWLISVLAEDLGVSARYAGLLRGVESFGQCAAFGVNSSRFNLTYTVVIIIVFWAVSLPSSFITILKVGIAEGYGGSSAAVAGDVEKRGSETGDDSSDLEDEKRESEEDAKPAAV